jgi:hypothetical protein
VKGSGGQEITYILRNPDFHYCVDKRPASPRPCEIFRNMVFFTTTKTGFRYQYAHVGATKNDNIDDTSMSGA